MLHHSGLKIAILGTRGIPARYGGFETFAEELGSRLAARGHVVTVYCRRNFFRPAEEEASDAYRGMRLISLPTIRHKYLDTIFHTLLSFLDLWRRDFDLVLLCNAANSPWAWLVHLRGLPLLINVDGVERRRRKWNRLGRLWYRLGERCSVWFASRVIADAQVIADYYRENYGAPSAVIAYGAERAAAPPGAVLQRFGLEAGKYLLYVSRLEPENNALGVIEAYGRLSTSWPLVVVGDAPYARSYIDRLRQTAGPGVVFTGFQFGEAYRELRSNCYLYIQATEVGGTHPALVEALAYGNWIAANDTPEHREVLGEAGRYYRFNDFEQLGEVLGAMLSHPEEGDRERNAALRRAEENYSWEKITDQYEALFRETVSAPTAPGGS